MIKKAWKEDIRGSKMFRITHKIKRYKVALLKWRNGFIEDSRKRISTLKQQLIEEKSSDIEGRKERIAVLKNQLLGAYREKEQYWSQKARINWLQERDKNTKYFHAMVKGRRKKKQDKESADGGWILDN